MITCLVQSRESKEGHIWKWFSENKISVSDFSEWFPTNLRCLPVASMLGSHCQATAATTGWKGSTDSVPLWSLKIFWWHLLTVPKDDSACTLRWANLLSPFLHGHSLFWAGAPSGRESEVLPCRVSSLTSVHRDGCELDMVRRLGGAVSH